MPYMDLGLQRKQEIEDQLLLLMLDTPYDRIPVKDLTEKLQIARKTFYHYFHNKQACLESLMDRMILESNLSLLSLPEHASPEEQYAALLQFWICNRGFLEALGRNGLDTLFVRRILLYIRRDDSSIPFRLGSSFQTCDEDMLYYCVSGHVCLMLKWCREGFSRPPEEMTQIIIRLSRGLSVCMGLE